jgi:hypothetical protein
MRLKSVAEFAVPCAVFERLARPRGSLNRSDVHPRLEVAGAIAMMQRIDHSDAGFSRGVIASRPMMSFSYVTSAMVASI